MKKRILYLLSSFLLICCILLCSCTSESGKDDPSGNEYTDIESNESKPDYGPYYVENYPRTKIAFTYSDMYMGTVPAAGDITVMIIPIHWNEGYEFDDAYLKELDDYFFNEEKSENSSSIKTYFETASYGKIHMDYEVLPTWYMENSYDEYRMDNGGYIMQQLVMDAYENALLNSTEDINRFDSNGDGFADAVIFVHNIQSPNGASYTHQMDEYEINLVTGLSLQPRFYATCYYSDFIRNNDFRCNTVTHEISHMFGLDDYYDIMGYTTYLTRFDLMEGGIGDWNPFSKLSVGWIEPYVITNDVDKVTLKLRCSAEYPDAILIPSSSGWNGSAFDEYILVDVFAPKGTNKAPWQFYALKDSSNMDGGVRVLHVNGTYLYYDLYTLDTYGAVDVNNYDREYALANYRVMSSYSNSSESEDVGADQGFHELTMIPCEGTLQLDYIFDTSYLFGEGSSFSMEQYGEKFSQGTQLDGGGTVPYRFTVDHYDREKAEAIITVEKIK